MINWNLVPYFKRQEFDDPLYPGSGDLIDGVYLMAMVNLRKKTGWPIIIHSAVGGAVDVGGVHGHKGRSYHRKDMGCKASDWHFKTDISPRIQYLYVAMAGFPGLGIYYDWQWNGKPLPIGFHTDLRPSSRAQVWTRKNGKYIYLLN